MTECAPEMPVKSALVPMGAESARRCSSVPPVREGAHFGAGLKSPCQFAEWREAASNLAARRAVLEQQHGAQALPVDGEQRTVRTRREGCLPSSDA